MDLLPEIPLSVQKQIEADGGNAMREPWREAVDDLHPPPSTTERCNIQIWQVYTGQYGFQEDMEFDSDGELSILGNMVFRRTWSVTVTES